MKKFFLSALCALTLGLMVTSCNDDDPVSNGSGTEETALQGAILINEGSMGLNNAGVTFYDKASGEVSVRATTVEAKSDTMKAMPSGTSIRPSMPSRKKSGRKHTTTMSVELRMGIRTSREAS